MRRLFIATVMAAMVLGLVAQPGLASATKYTFNDVKLPNGETGEIEANVKTKKNKDDSVYCGYFTDDYEESLGYYFDFYGSAPTDRDRVLEICLDHFDERNS